MEPTDGRQFHSCRGSLRKLPTVSNLPIDASALYLLAGPSVPEQARQVAIEKAEAGDRITKAEAQKLIAEAKPARAISKFAPRCKPQNHSDLSDLHRPNAKPVSHLAIDPDAADFMSPEIRLRRCGERPQSRVDAPGTR